MVNATRIWQVNFCSRRQALGLPLDEFEIVVDETDRSESDGRDDHQPHIAVGHIGPEQRGQHNGKDDENPAHGRRSAFCQMPLRPVVSNLLPEFDLLQLDE